VRNADRSCALAFKALNAAFAPWPVTSMTTMYIVAWSINPVS
jgi:hypothetical protein